MAKSSSPSFPKGFKVITGPGDTIKSAAKIGGASIKVTDNATTQAPLSTVKERADRRASA